MTRLAYAVFLAALIGGCKEESESAALIDDEGPCGEDYDVSRKEAYESLSASLTNAGCDGHVTLDYNDNFMGLCGDQKEVCGDDRLDCMIFATQPMLVASESDETITASCKDVIESCNLMMCRE